MVYLTVCHMVSSNISNPGLFITQTVFAINNQPILMGVLKKGDLTIAMNTTIKGKTYELIDIQILKQHQKSVKSEGKEIIIGISLKDISIEDAQKIINQELIFE